MKLGKNFIIFCPPFCATGGTELLHQLTYELIKLGIDAKICYGKIENNNNINPTPDKFVHYINEAYITYEPFDNPNDVHIYPEVFAPLCLKYKKATKLFWWLSVDNFFLSIDNYLNNKYSFIQIRFLKSVLKKYFISNFFNSSNCYLHLYQSEYARLFLVNNNIKNFLHLGDYLSQEIVNNPKCFPRENIILYNPRKGYEFIKKIMEKDILNRWIALENMSIDELTSLYKRAKVYVDFGHHPGKDRIPREAAVNGCIVITSKLGSCNNFIDVPIHNMYKLEKNEINDVDIVLDIINKCILNYDSYKIDFEEYRNIIINERNKFTLDVHNLVNLLSSKQ